MGNEAKFTRNLRDLFKAMSTGGDMWGKDIPHFNGGLFYANDAEQDVIGLDGIDARIVLSAARLDWADVDPSIFGSLFERALDIEGRRAELGAHYTSREDIETIVEPVLMRPLRAAWGDVKLRASKMAASGKPKAAIKKLLGKFLDTLAALKVLDPACGSGNFLYVSLKLLKDLEQEVIAFAANLGITDFEPRVNPAQLYGIEKDRFRASTGQHRRVDRLLAVEVEERLRTGGRDAHPEAVEQHSVHGCDFGSQPSVVSRQGVSRQESAAALPLVENRQSEIQNR